MTRASTTLTRFALVLLVLSGVVAPVAPVETARVVQTVGGKPSPQTSPSLQVVSVALEAPTWPVPGVVEPAEVVDARHPNASRARRYLLHRAWLI